MEKKQCKLNVKQLVDALKTFPPGMQMQVACDEELNVIYNGFKVTKLDNGEGKEMTIVLFPLSGTETDNYLGEENIGSD